MSLGLSLSLTPGSPILYNGVMASYRVMATRGQTAGGVADGGGSSGATANMTQFITRTRFLTGNEPVVSPKILVGNFKIFNSSGEAAVGNSITVEAMIELGSPTRITFGGSNSVVLADGSDPVESDALGGVTLSANTYYYVKTFVSVTAGQKVPLAGAINANGQRCIAGTAISAQFFTNSALVAGGADSAVTVSGMFPPLGLLGLTRDWRNVLFTGDSIADGSGESSSGDGVGAAVTGGGFILRGLYAAGLGGTLIPSIKATRGSELMRDLASSAGARRKLMMAKAGVFIDALGGNDFSVSGGRSLAQLQDDSMSVWEAAKSAGSKRIAKTTLIPRTSSSNNWVDAAGQTPDSGYDTKQLAYNEWLLTQVGQGLLTDVIDVCAAAADPGNQAKWKSTGVAAYATADGTHPTSAVHGDMAAVVAAWASAL